MTKRYSGFPDTWEFLFALLPSVVLILANDFFKTKKAYIKTLKSMDLKDLSKRFQFYKFLYKFWHIE
jgi:hypothetical protein